MKDKRKKKRRKIKKKVIIILLVVFALIVSGIIIFVIASGKDNNISNKEPVQIKDNMEDYDYYLNDNATSYYEELYRELEDILNEEVVDDALFAKTITKLFITDVFTLDNKISSSDIGGLQFIHTKFKDDFVSIAKTNLYSSVQSNIYGDRKQKLPVVNKVEITSEKTSTFTYKKVKYDSYVFNATIGYEKDLGYPSKYKVTLIKNDKYWQVVAGE